MQLLFFVLLGVTTAVTSAKSFNLLPLGDSITFGCGATSTPPDYWAYCTGECGGYRTSIYVNSTSLKYPIKFVGSQNSGPSSVPKEANNHEGHPGWRTQQITNISSTWLSYSPDVILIHLGTNDLGQNHTLQQMTADMTSLLTLIQQKGKPGVRVFVATILRMVNPMHPYWIQWVENYNAALPAVVQNSAAAGLNVSLVDLYDETNLCSLNLTALDCCSGNGPSSPHPDRVHPTGSGYDTMGFAWWKSIQPTLAWLSGL